MLSIVVNLVKWAAVRGGKPPPLDPVSGKGMTSPPIVFFGGGGIHENNRNLPPPPN